MTRRWDGAALYEVTVHHTRTEPVTNSFTYGGYYWWIDIDRPPAPRWPLRMLAGFEARDHAGAPGAGLRANLDSYLADHDIDLSGGNVMLLTQARVFGHVFNPLSVYWCHRRDGGLECIVAEVHNTFGGRHRYLLDPDGTGYSETLKEFYVSPFIPIDGTYHLHLPRPGERLALSITLKRPDAPPFAASLSGRRLPANPRTLIRMAVHHPLAPLVGALRIRIQGVKLAWRRVPVVARPRPPAPGSGNDSHPRAPGVARRVRA